MNVAVCEVGMGGRLDATNVLTPVVTAITSIGHDHQQYLGNSLREIAAEKAGIIKTGVPVILGRLDEDSAAVVSTIARERGAPCIDAAEGCVVVDEGPGEAGGHRIRVRTPRRDYGPIDLALAGAHQIDNALVAVRILEALDESGLAVPPDAVRRGLSVGEVAGPARSPGAVRRPGRAARRGAQPGRRRGARRISSRRRRCAPRAGVHGDARQRRLEHAARAHAGGEGAGAHPLLESCDRPIRTTLPASRGR